MSPRASTPKRLRLRAGEWVEVRSASEILSTLDADGALDGLPFMPEMLALCGRRFRVLARAHKTCDTVNKTGGRRMRDAVHLDGAACDGGGARCDGSGHGGCQAACLLFFKEAWLRRADAPTAVVPAAAPEEVVARLEAAASRPGPDGAPRYRCQATELPRATQPLSAWDPRQYLEDLTSGNTSLRELVWVLAVALYNQLQAWRDGGSWPSLESRARGRTPSRRLDLQPGERVRVRSKAEIEETLKDGRNRGMWFDVECVQFCERTYRVGPRIERILNEETGEMMELANDCLILEGVVCTGRYTPQRLLCPRRIFPYWREIWLERVDGADPDRAPGRVRPDTDPGPPR